MNMNGKMIFKIKEKIISDKLSTRVLWLTIVFVVIFYGVTVFSYFVLPDGFLLKKNSVTNFKTSENLIICAMQIFSYNMISIVVIMFGSLFARKKDGEKGYKSYGCLGFFVFTILNAITLGTWSFTVNTNSVPLMERIIRTFDIVHNAGLLEMYGQLLITSVLVTKYLVMTEGKNTTTRRLKDLKIETLEIVTFICGLLLMFAGALIESHAIVS